MLVYMTRGRTRMVGLVLGTLTLLCWLLGVFADCPEETVEAIKSFWKGKPPANILKSQEGTVTYVWMTRKFMQLHVDRGLYCFATNLAADLTSSTDILIYRNRTPEEFTYFQTEKDGVITLHSHGEPSDTQYVISQKDHVSTFWQCKMSNIEKYDPFVGISVGMQYVDTEEARYAIREGIIALKYLGINTGARLAPCTEENIKI